MGVFSGTLATPPLGGITIVLIFNAKKTYANI